MQHEKLPFRLRIRAHIRRNILTRKSVAEGKPDRISDLLDEAADEIERLERLQVSPLNRFINYIMNLYDRNRTNQNPKT